jgi:4-hydroxybenzoyl-CoA reductase alpha subunit
MTVHDDEFSVIGKSYPRLEGIEKVTGATRFLTDMELPGMLHGKVLRSSYPHARIISINTEKAEKLSGVKGVITAEDTPKIPYCLIPRVANKLPLEDKKVRYTGDEVAAVAAETEGIATEALDLIEVVYEELPTISDSEEAMKPDAPLLYEEEGTNIAEHFHKEYGDVEKGFQESDIILEDRFETSPVTPCCMEPRSCLASFDGSGRLTLIANTQAPFSLRLELSKVIPLPLKKIRIIKLPIGSAFGSRFGMDPIDPICVFLSRKTGRPVKIVNTREEEFVTSRYRYRMVIHLKTGAKKDGTLVAREAKVITDNGGYNYQGYTITAGLCQKLTFVYKIPNIKFDGYVVYTNNVYGGAFRGYGNPQITFAAESHIDMIAEKLGMDVLDLSLKNIVEPGYKTVSNCHITSCGLRDCMTQAADSAGWRRKRRKGGRRGIGMASMQHVGGGIKAFFGNNCNFSSATIKVNEDGTVNLMSGSSDIGQGSDTVLAQIAAEELGIRFEDVRIITADTDVTSMCLGTWGDRVTFIGGLAVQNAARDAKKQLLELASEVLEANTDDLESREGRVFVKGSSEKAISIAELAWVSYFSKSKPILGRGFYEDPISIPDPETGYGGGPTYSFATQVAEVEVDVETGKVKVLKITSAHDLGRAINPRAVRGQIEGALAQGIGSSLYERLEWVKGKTLNANFLDYRMLTALDMSTIKPILIESIDPNGPFGAKGVGEPALVPTAAAIANAIYDAVGVRIKSLPITPDKILAALEEKDSISKRCGNER